ncbi:SUMF1/EgtB/PvdO family nonheme iron enzyme [Hyphococcus sp.]|jgi:formylglycine-generating enzyme required for sulfatase activity|uniref:SUMF1/EgtB/PvdO family nonheme iron enzyme n=1 Tax=Hyphococcus sp. TaxID=2038636 RepID=UPI003D0A292A
MPQQEPKPDAKGVVQLLAASANANFADKIAKALLRAGYRLDPGAFDPGRIDAVVVLWTGVALDKPALIEVAREAWKAKRLTPVSIGRVEPPFGSREATPMDLAGWRGDDDDPRWRFVLSDIEALKARAELEDHEPVLSAPFKAQALMQKPVKTAPEETARGKASPQPFDDLFTEEDGETTPHHPARALWRGRLLPAAPIFAGIVGALAFAAGISFMAGSLSSRPQPIENGPIESPPMEQVAQEEAPDATPEEPAPSAKLALVRLAPGAQLPETQEAQSQTAEDETAPKRAPENLQEQGVETASAIDATALEDTFEDSLPGLAETESASEFEEESETAPEAFAALSVPSLKPAQPEAAEAAAIEDEIPLVSDLNHAALAELASAVERAERVRKEESTTREDYLGDYFTDCAGCPDMAALEGGVFTMGARPGEEDRQAEETPQRRIDIGYRFAIATRETTFDQWALCAAEGGCRNYIPDDEGWGRGDRPVINVSYEDASAYARWLSAKTGHHYRLPSEAEWEYAARAGTAGATHFGDRLSAADANFNGREPYRAEATIFRERTVPVTQFAHNAFGLFDMHGNVAEWTLDCWNASHNGAPSTGAARIDGDCARRVVKGGDWRSPGWRLRSAARAGEGAETRNAQTGFRVVRTLD